jgi:hypothetical protein
MNGRTSKLLRKVADKRGMGKSKRYSRWLKRQWYSLTTQQRTKTRTMLQNFINL